MSAQKTSEQQSDELPTSIKIRMLADQIDETLLDIQLALRSLRGLAEHHR